MGNPLNNIYIVLGKPIARIIGQPNRNRKRNDRIISTDVMNVSPQGYLPNNSLCFLILICYVYNIFCTTDCLVDIGNCHKKETQ